MNDPNGLVFDGETYHLFYQYYPYDTFQGPMHWGHATSQNLHEFREVGIALEPDAHGQCFSGSAVPAVAGPTHPHLAEGAYLLYYTASLTRPGQPDLQSQCVALADSTLTRIEKSPSNPIIANPGLVDFRDPKVFWHAESSRWIMVLSHGTAIGIYGSPDGLDWRNLSSFDNPVSGTGVWECPDLFRLKTPRGKAAWILVVGLGEGGATGGSGTQYFLGQFDGTTFIGEQPLPQWLDHGSDFYAAQSWAGTGDDDGRTIIAWMGNWRYARRTPAVEVRGTLSLPRRLHLEDAPTGVVLKQNVLPSVLSSIPKLELTEHQRDRWSALPQDGCFQFEFDLELEPGETRELRLFGMNHPTFTFEGHAGGNVNVRYDRPAAELGSVDQFAASSEAMVTTAKVSAHCIVDNGLVELSLCGGSVWFSSVHFPEDCLGEVSVA